MFKKISHIILIVFLLVYTSGITVYKHYCGANLIKQTVNIVPESCCKGPCKCCHNEEKQYKITDNFEVNSNSFSFANEFSKIIHQFDFSMTLFNVIEPKENSNILFYRAKICENHLLLRENLTSILQVFRL